MKTDKIELLVTLEKILSYSAGTKIKLHQPHYAYK
jgi:hypothetical protein